MSDQTTTTQTVSPAQQRAADQAAKRAAKQAEKDARKAANAEKRANGVIGTLHAALQSPFGVTKHEVLRALAEKFPDRDVIGMSTTVGIQLSRLQKKHGRIVSRVQGERGRVYGYASSVQFQPEGSNGVAPAAVPVPEPTATPAPTPEPTADPIVDVQEIHGYVATHESGKTEVLTPVADTAKAMNKADRKAGNKKGGKK